MVPSFDFRGLHCYAPATEDGAWTYLPAVADVQRGREGQPLLTFSEFDRSAYLLFAARWNAAACDVAALREELATRVPAAHASRLRAACLRETSCTVRAADGRGGFTSLGTSATSGMPPYDAVFNLYLNGEALEQVRAALRGDVGRLAIEYRGNRIAAACARARFSASGTSLGTYWRAHARDGNAAQVLEHAVADGAARIDVDAPDPFAGALAPELYRRVLERAAEIVPPLLEQAPGADVQALVSLEQEVDIPVRACADVGALVAAESLASLIGGHHASD